MSFFTDPGINDEQYKIWGGPWGNPWYEVDPEDGRMPKLRAWNPKQLELELVQFFPLTEQIALDLSFEGCDTQTTIPNAYTTLNTVSGGVTWATTVATNIAPQLTITPIDSVGELSIGGIRVGLEKKPSWLQRKLHKLLGFNWSDK